MSIKQNSNGGLNQTSDKGKKLLILLGILVIIALLIFIIINIKISTKTNVTVETEPSGIIPAGPDASVTVKNPEFQDATATVDIKSLEGAKVVVPGANPITVDDKVVTPEGRIATSTERPMEGDAPRQTGFLKKEDLPTTLVKVEVGNGKFSPTEFKTHLGAPTSFSLTGVDKLTHLIAFDSPALSAVIIMVGPGQTKAITFNAPDKAGEYTFRCDSPGHAEKGETGKMYVY
ncbi:MAG: cupredoxin domain-containing protein [Patescibacteria group bacterium]|jgi:plastocyanin